MAHDTIVGLNAQVSPDRQQGRIVLGYDRDFVTIIPKSVEDPATLSTTADHKKRDVMALLGCSELEVSGIFLTRYVEVLASGKAAENFAATLTGDTTFFDCYKLSPEPVTPEQPASAGGT